MELRREMNMAIHEAKFSFTRLKIIVWGQARSKTGKRKEEREGEKVRVRKEGGRNFLFMSLKMRLPAILHQSISPIFFKNNSLITIHSALHSPVPVA